MYEKEKLDPSKVTIIIPTLNEEKGIGYVIDSFKKLGYNNILVIDGNSKDRTREIAREKGARVIVQSGRGKGQAVAEAFNLVDSDVVVLIDGDGTYPPEDIEKMLEPIRKGIADHVIGNRLVNYEKGAFTRLNLLGNKILNWVFRFLYGHNLYDILSGYRALTKEVYKSVELEKHGFEVEAELTVETLAKGYRIVEVPINYRRRAGDTKLSPLRDGLRIGKALIELLVRYNPARYFYLLGILFSILGLITGIYVVSEWLKGVTHYLLATLTAIFVLMGVQFAVIGFVVSLLFRVMVELKRAIRELKKL
ncbi:S-layer glycoprotein N-glycosyltransferase AglJ [Pyrococcus sp. ST04]|uniref:S-layer glycoprotein N-glycosyltransferase AglJ n=1 Tax=Pyrococcus sp. ST04 TaxID=1183377 RepID=UPI0002605A7A|nr:S-layer glycoprotein N-glycosyltransferase AglJ [Pyrococcus sp. ST04]AFK22059.1 putative glycosyl transferase family 2 protein [Pyrococcus sp. ST04]